MFPTIRKSFAIIEEHDDPDFTTTESTTTEAEGSEACTSRKRLQADDINIQEKKQVLRARLKELREINVCINKAHRVLFMPPQIMDTTSPQDDRAELIDTDAESDLDEDEDAKDDAEVVEPAPRPCRRHQFTSAVNRQKHCPYCKKLITRRPVRNYRLREISETLGSDLPLNEAPSARRCRNDIWHGIFHPENRNAGHLGPEYLVEVGDVAEVMARRERARLEAFEEGRRRGILETRQRWARAEEARRIAMARPITMHEVRFGQGNPLWAGHAPLVANAVPRPAAVPIPQVPEALPARDAPPI
ncbi:hypothetical protein Clacol_008940 [Clathrus columnatus]|uniref:Uncharacterized protein n=1 Tax=Clathrus columnatus TaxID=1419009 RepID=A0AAV5ANE7_9AGAM|nr:hypothetical protein Clacol_008940 [Clathrus columnatus]